MLSRTIARRLNTQGEEVLFERIPAMRRRLQREVEELVLQTVSTADSTAIPDLYARRLMSFFDGPKHFGLYLLKSQRPREILLADLDALDRFLNAQEREIVADIADRIRVKDDLDYQYAHQAILKSWLFVHIPLTYSLLIFSLLHAVLVYAFFGGIR